MPSEFEELKLTVSLVDNASAGIANLRQQLQQLQRPGEPLEKVKQFAKEAKEGFKELGTEVGSLIGKIGPLGNMALNVAGVVGNLGFALYDQAIKLKEWSEQIVSMTNAARQIGISYGEFRHVAEQMEQVGSAPMKPPQRCRD